MIIETLEDYQKAISADPLPEDIKTNPDGSKYIPISVIQNKLDQIFPVWSWDLTREFFGRSGITCKGILSLYHPLLPNAFYRSGTVAVVRTQEMRMDYPKAESMCMLNAAKKIGRWFGRDLNRDKDDAPVNNIALVVEEEKKVNDEVEQALANAKAELDALPTYEAALEYFEKSGFKYNHELKKILKSKKPKTTNGKV
jgi:hypothetical protein